MSSKTILVTGATSGIGRAAALELARRGHVVFATGRRQPLLQSLLHEAAGTGLRVLQLDVTDPASIQSAREAVGKATGGRGLDVLINNAGYGQAGPTELITDADLRRQFDTNVFGLMAMTRAFVPLMRDRGAGRVINVTSIGGRLAMPFMGTYTATKFAVECLSDALRVELKPFGVDVVVVEPGPIATNFASTSHGSVAGYEAGSGPYAPWLAAADDAFSSSDTVSFPVGVVTRQIRRAVEARRPRSRYVAPGFLQPLVWLAELMPAFVTDAVLGLALRRMCRHGQAQLATA